MAYIYEQLPSLHHIRLIQIHREPSAPLTLSMHQADLNDKPQYHALSYAWDGAWYTDVEEGWSTLTQSVTVNGQTVSIRQNLHDALLQLRLLEMWEPIWIDAICINQSDILERNAQVRQMARIYADAKKVLIWLGKEDRSTALAVRAVEKLQISMEEMLNGNIDPMFVRNQTAGCTWTREEKDAILEFFVKPRWFSRVWTVQEFVLAREPEFLRGLVRLPLEPVWKGSLLLTFIPYIRDWNAVRGPVTELGYVRDFFGLTIVWHERRLSNPWVLSIGQNAYMFRRQQAFDARDKVFGLAGISGRCYSIRCRVRISDTQLIELSHKTIPYSLVVDYNKTVQTVFTEAALFHHAVSDGLQSLSSMGNRKLNKIADLPSWVPDLTKHDAGTEILAEHREFRTASHLKPVFELSPNDPKCLNLSLAYVDSIDAVCDPCWERNDRNGLRKFYHLLLSPTPPNVASADELSNMLSSILTGGHHDPGFEGWLFTQTASALASSDSRLVKGFLENPEANLPKVMEALGVPTGYTPLSHILLRGHSDYDPSKGVEIHPDGLRRTYENPSANDKQRIVFNTQRGVVGLQRCLFRTKRGYLGLGSETTQPGDSLCIVQGARVPYIFRPCHGEEGNYMKLEGEAYAHRIMHGEAFKTGSIEFQLISIR
jgi:hypothetical protein